MIKAAGIELNPKKNTNYLNEWQVKLEKETTQLLFFTFLHLPLGMVLYNIGLLGIIHPVAVFIFGLYWAISKKVKIERIAYLVAYLIGCEILWRMASIPIFWEFGKYGSSLIMIVALIRRKRYKIPGMPLLFIILLFPACFVTLAYNDFSTARDQISFNISGPFTLFICCWFFSNLKFTHLQTKRLFIILLIPLLTVALTTFFYTVSNSEEITFNNESNFATSGGFGPNQVSSMLGLGVFIALAGYLVYKNDFKFNLYFLIGAVFLATQSILTFSRGGIYNALGAVGVLAFFQSQNIIEMLKRILPIVIAAGVFLLLLFPFMNDFTGGKLQERFEDTETTRRGDIIESDIQIMMENPLLGVGLGNAKTYREKFLGYEAASHTEFSRLISEHGLFGIFSILVLLWMTFLNLLKQSSVFGRAIIAGAIVWCSLFMLNAGMRLAAPSFLWGFSFINIVGKPIDRKKLNPIENKSK